jgi:DNA-binding NarL/FixJ family response regulator
MVLVAAAPTLQRQGLLATLQEMRPDLLLSTTSQAHALAMRLVEEVPALLILDSQLPGLPLPALLDKVWAARPEQRLLVLSQRRLPLALRQRLQAQAAHVVLAHNSPDKIVQMVELLLTLQHAPPAHLLPAAQLLARPRLSPPKTDLLSTRELEVLRLVVNDLENTEIARQLCLSVRTVESHRRTLLQKTGTRTLVGLAVRAMREGWVV